MRWSGYDKQQRKIRRSGSLRSFIKSTRWKHCALAYLSLKREAAPGVDGETWRHYGEDLEENLHDLSHRLKRGAYRAKPVRRVYIPKTDGRLRPLGVTALEDKIVQRAAVEVLNAIYETDFLGFSYGFRPGRSQHNALDALYTGLVTTKVNWVLDLDIRSFFDAISHEWLVKFIGHRIADRRVIRLIQKWLNAGVLEDGKRIRMEEGTPQGGSASPLMANIYLHYVFDLWVHAWRRTRAHGDVIAVRYADDIVIGFQIESDAKRFRMELAERIRKFQLELHPDKTRLLGVRPVRGPKPGTARRREAGNVRLPWLHAYLREDEKQRLLHGAAADDSYADASEAERGKRRTQDDACTIPSRKVGAMVAIGRLVATYRYYGVPMNGSALGAFRLRTGLLWRSGAQSRRSQTGTSVGTESGTLDRPWLPSCTRISSLSFRARMGVIT